MALHKYHHMLHGNQIYVNSESLPRAVQL